MPIWGCTACRVPGVLACIVLLNLHHPLPCRFWSAPLPSHLRRPPEWHNTVIRWILSWNVTDPVLFPSPHFTTDVFSHCHLQNCLVRDMLLPSVLENSSRAISLKGVYPLFLCFWWASKSHIHKTEQTGPGSWKGRLWCLYLYSWPFGCSLASWRMCWSLLLSSWYQPYSRRLWWHWQQGIWSCQLLLLHYFPMSGWLCSCCSPSALFSWHSLWFQLLLSCPPAVLSWTGYGSLLITEGQCHPQSQGH